MTSSQVRKLRKAGSGSERGEGEEVSLIKGSPRYPPPPPPGCPVLVKEKFGDYK